MRKAKAWLENNNLDFEYIDLIKNTPNKEELKRMFNVSGCEIKKLFNTNGTRYKELNMKERINNEDSDSLIELLSTDGMLIKRPIVFDDKNILFGFKENEWIETLLK